MEEIEFLNNHTELTLDDFDKEKEKIDAWTYFKSFPKLKDDTHNLEVIVPYSESMIKEVTNKIANDKIRNIVKDFEDTIKEKYQIAYASSDILKNLYEEVKMTEASRDEQKVRDAIQKFYETAEEEKKGTEDIDKKRTEVLERFHSLKEKISTIKANSKNNGLSLLDLIPIERRLAFMEGMYLSRIENPMIDESSKIAISTYVESLEKELEKIETNYSAILENKQEMKNPNIEVEPQEDKKEQNEFSPNHTPVEQMKKNKDFYKEIIEHAKSVFRGACYTKPDMPSQNLFYYVICNFDLKWFNEEDFEEYKEMFREASSISPMLAEESKQQHLANLEEYKKKLWATKPKNSMNFKSLAIKTITYKMPTEKDWKANSNELVRFIIEDTKENEWSSELYKAFNELFNLILAMPNENNEEIQQHIEGFKNHFLENVQQMHK
jgi:hypothetical protein